MRSVTSFFLTHKVVCLYNYFFPLDVSVYQRYHQHKSRSYRLLGISKPLIHEQYFFSIADISSLPKAWVVLSKYTMIYPSNRAVGETLCSPDDAEILLRICTTDRDGHQLTMALESPTWTAIALAKPHRIYHENDPALSDSDTREVFARPILNLQTMIQKSAQHKNSTAVRKLIAWGRQQGHGPETLINRDVVMLAISDDSAAVLAELVAAQPETVNFQLPSGPVLCEAVYHSSPEVVDFLLEHGADAKAHPLTSGNVHGYRSSLLSAAASRGSAQIAESLVKHGAQVSRSGGMQMAAECGSIDVMEVLLRHGVDIDERLPEENIYHQCRDLLATRTPLHFAAVQDRVDVGDWLLQRGADASLKDGYGMTPGAIALRKGNYFPQGSVTLGASNAESMGSL